MRTLQMKYNLLHILFWASYLSIFGYVAIFLQYRGLTNTQIGIVTGGGAILSIFLSPFISSLIDRIKNLTMKALIFVLYIFMFILFMILKLITVPVIVIMICYILLLSLVVSVVPFLSMICMNYLKNGEYINFGLSRGLGSISYAICAVIVGQLVDILNPTVIIYTHLISGILFLILLYSLPECSIEKHDRHEKASAIQIIKKYHTFFMILVGFTFMFASATSLSTYLINIVHNLGGSTSLYGIAVFLMAASEMPIMSITHRLLKRYRGETLIIVAAIFYLLRNIIISFAPNLVVLMIGMLFQGVSYGLLTATITYYVTDHLLDSDQMMGQTLIGMMTTGLGSSLGNICGGLLQDTFGLASMLYFACGLTILGFIIMIFTLRKFLNFKIKKDTQSRKPA